MFPVQYKATEGHPSSAAEVAASLKTLAAAWRAHMTEKSSGPWIFADGSGWWALPHFCRKNRSAQKQRTRVQAMFLHPQKGRIIISEVEWQLSWPATWICANFVDPKKRSGDFQTKTYHHSPKTTFLISIFECVQNWGAALTIFLNLP